MTATSGARRVFESDRDGKARPDWAVDVLAALSDAGTAGFARSDDAPRLTSGEQDLLDAIGYRLRGRLGENAKPSYTAMADVLLKSGLAKIAAESRVSAKDTTGVPAYLKVTATAAAVSAVAAVLTVMSGDRFVAALWAVSAVAFAVTTASQWPRSGRRNP